MNLSFPMIFSPYQLVLAQYEDRAFRVVVDTYVTDKDGTGIVHQAPGFGEDDHRIALAYEIINADEMPPCPIDDAGRFTSEVPDFVGQYVKVSVLRDIFCDVRWLIQLNIYQDADKEIRKNISIHSVGGWDDDTHDNGPTF
jgi:isoleucyl-tRNA synthetase